MKGIDIFNGTNITSWADLKASGVQAVYIKATEGRTYQNPALKAQYNGAKSVDMLVGFYHFAGKVSTVDQEYDNFINTTKSYKTDLKPCLDYELDNPMATWIDVFMQKYSKLILYTSHSILKLVSYPLSRVWIAEPNTSPKDTGSYAGIQFTWTGKLNGLSGDADIDLFSNEVLLSNNIVLASQSQTKPTQTVYNIKYLQHELNTQLNAGLVEDNIAGPKTLKKCPTVKHGANGNITRWIQNKLGIKVDGDFGIQTLISVQNYQKAHGLQKDGIIGENTWKALLNL